MRISHSRIPFGNPGIARTVQAMRGLAHQALEYEVFHQWAGLAAGDSCCAPGAIDGIRSFLVGNVVFEPDPEGVELIRDPLYMLGRIESLGIAEGDCDDVATLGAALGLANELPAQFRLLSFAADGVYSHVFAELWNGEAWQELDTTRPALLPEGLRITAEETVEV